MWTRGQLKSQAKKSFRGDYGKSVVAVLILYVITIICAGTSMLSSLSSLYKSIMMNREFLDGVEGVEALDSMSGAAGAISTGNMIVNLVSLFILPILAIGICRLFMRMRYKKAEYSDLVYRFKNRYLSAWGTSLLMGIFIMLWSLLLFIPGIIKQYSYRMIPYILAENPNIGYKKAFEISKKTMKGEKWRLFVLDLSFIGWDILTVLTLGIATIFWIRPYKEATYAEFYAVMREKAFAQSLATSEELPGFED